MVKLFGEGGATLPAFHQVLSGAFSIPSNCDQYGVLFLKALHHPQSLPVFLPKTIETYQQGWQHTQKTTSSSMSGIHFGHYIASTFNPNILVINAMMANLPLTTGYSPKPWQQGLNVMLEKTPGDFNMEKLCIILLFEVDFNANNKWLGRAVWFQVENFYLLAMEQYGSQKIKSASFKAWTKVFSTNTSDFVVSWQPSAPTMQKAAMTG